MSGAKESVLHAIASHIEAHLAGQREADVSPSTPLEELHALLEALTHDSPRELTKALDLLAIASRSGEVKTSHPRYFGLPSASPSELGIAGAALADALSTQLATFHHAPFAALAEASLVTDIAARFGFVAADDRIPGGCFTSGGQEANLTAMVLALHRAFPEVRQRGLRALSHDPVLYASQESHPSLLKAARILGLGDEAVRLIKVDDELRMREADLRERLANDRLAGKRPFLLVGTAGTTTSGAIDPLSELATIAQKENMFFHVDAAWGGMAALVPEAAHHLRGIALADSITFDPHKTLDVPLGAGMLLVRDKTLLPRTFAIDAPYMPRANDRDAYASSVLWSRPFLGLRLLLPLAVLGWGAHIDAIRSRIRLGNLLRERLVARGFHLRTHSILPLALFTDGAISEGATARHLTKLARGARARANAWLSLSRLPNGARALRAGIVSRHTTEADVEALVDALASSRDL